MKKRPKGMKMQSPNAKAVYTWDNGRSEVAERPFALEFRAEDSIQRHSGMTVISRASLLIKKMSLQWRLLN